MSSNPETNRDAPFKVWLLSLSLSLRLVFLLCLISRLHIFRPDITECPPAECKIRLSLKNVQSVLVTLTARKKKKKQERILTDTPWRQTFPRLWCFICADLSRTNTSVGPFGGSWRGTNILEGVSLISLVYSAVMISSRSFGPRCGSTPIKVLWKHVLFGLASALFREMTWSFYHYCCTSDLRVVSTARETSRVFLGPFHLWWFHPETASGRAVIQMLYKLNRWFKQKL